MVFRDPAGIRFTQNGIRFEGKAGLIREAADGHWQVAIFGGGTVARGGLVLTAGQGSVAAWASDAGAIEGRVSAPAAEAVQIAIPDSLSRAVLYLDGTAQGPVTGGRAVLQVPAGSHTWELSATAPHLIAPRVLRTDNGAGSADVYFAESAGATGYRIELSRDNGASWTASGGGAANPLRITGLRTGEKIHVRVIASNAAHSSAPGAEYPVYATDRPPEAPDGLRLHLENGQVEATWGEVLGAPAYSLYRRAAGGTWTQVYRGADRRFLDHVTGVVAPYPEPGMAAAAKRRGAAVPIYEYAVAAVNRNGEGARSVAGNTDPASWRNWDPKPGEPFRRRFTYNTTNYRDLGQEENTSRYYPK
jgi:hypothetical protein